MCVCTCTLARTHTLRYMDTCIYILHTYLHTYVYICIYIYNIYVCVCMKKKPDNINSV